MTLTTGRKYTLTTTNGLGIVYASDSEGTRFEFVGFPDGCHPSDYNVYDYFGPGGQYGGPDTHGIEPEWC